MKLEVVRTNANDIKLRPEMYAMAYDNGISLSQYLEQMDPTPPESKDGLDAFERQLLRFGIRTKADPRTGLGASRGEVFLTGEGCTKGNDFFFQSNLPASRILFPEFLNRVARVAVMNQENIINEMVAYTETLEGTNMMRALYIDDTQTDRTQSRVGEFGGFPVVKLSWSEKGASLVKYGVQIQMSYEFVRRCSLPLISLLIQRIMLQKRLDEVAEAISVLKLGDANAESHTSGAAISSANLSTYVGGNPTGFESMTYAGYLAWLYTFNPGRCTTIISNAADTALWMTMPKPTVDPIMLYSLLDKSLFGGVPTRPVNWPINTNITPVIHADVAENHLIGIDKSAALIAFREAGTDLTETNRIITNQFEQIVMSNTIGFSCLFASARKDLVGNA